MTEAEWAACRARQDARVPEGERPGQRKEVETPGLCLLSSNLAPLNLLLNKG